MGKGLGPAVDAGQRHPSGLAAVNRVAEQGGDARVEQRPLFLIDVCHDVVGIAGVEIGGAVRIVVEVGASPGVKSAENVAAIPGGDMAGGGPRLLVEEAGGLGQPFAPADQHHAAGSRGPAGQRVVGCQIIRPGQQRTGQLQRQQAGDGEGDKREPELVRVGAR